MEAPSKRTVGRPRRRGSPKYIRLRESVFLISGEMKKKLLAANSIDSVFAEFFFYIECWCSIVNKGPVEMVRENILDYSAILKFVTIRKI